MDAKEIKHQADLLRRSDKFDPSRTVGETPQEQLRAIGQDQRNAEVFGASARCPDCAKLQATDPNALCRTHLAAALGF